MGVDETEVERRVEIFREIAARADHPSAEAVLRAISPRMPTVSLDTVYRTLWLLDDLGLVSTLRPKRESVRFDANLAPHHHYFCVRRGLTRDFESAELDALCIPESVTDLGSIHATHIEVRGVCSRCAEERAQELENENPRVPRDEEGSTHHE